MTRPSPPRGRRAAPSLRLRAAPSSLPLRAAPSSLPLRAAGSSLRLRASRLLALAALLASASLSASARAGVRDTSAEVELPDRKRELRVFAVRVDEAAMKLDGRVDEPAWAGVPPLPELIQESPRFGHAPSHATEVRVAYGERGLWVSFVCHGDPARIRAPFFARDQQVTSDLVWFEVDPNNDDTTGYMVAVTPSNAIIDAQLSRDTLEERLWDGVWEVATSKQPDGWQAEFLIPYSTLRFRPAATHTFGINAGRFVNDGAEQSRLSLMPQGTPGRVSAAVDYTGLTGLDRGRDLELVPYLSGRFALQRPADTLDHSWVAMPNAGLDLRYAITGKLALELALNPDFGQAEVDPAVLNLGPFEAFFPEKRRFFLSSKELFETRFGLFYSRRVGNNPRPDHADLSTRTIAGEAEQGELVELDPSTRILAAARLTGEIAPNWVLGALAATTGPTFGVEAFSDGSEAPVEVDPYSVWSVLRLRRQFSSLTHVGGIVTNVARAGDEPEATTGGLDYNLNFLRSWNHDAQVIGTHDGEQSGMGAALGLSRWGKRTGLTLTGQTLTPHANFNDIGYMTRANYLRGETSLHLYNARPVGRLRRIGASATAVLESSYEAWLTEKSSNIGVDLTGRSLWSAGVRTGGHLPQMDLYETRGGIPYEVPRHWWVHAHLSSPDNRRVGFTLGGAYGEQAGRPGPDLDLTLRLRPVDRLQFTLGGEYHGQFGRPRWVSADSFARPVFGLGVLHSTNATLRGTLAILPTLSFTTFEQLFYSTAHHTDFFVLTDPRTLMLTSPVPYEGVVDQALTSLVSNSVLRWEYRPGSFVFLVYTHRTVYSEGGQTVKYAPAKAFTNLGEGEARHEDVLFVKLSHLFGA